MSQSYGNVNVTTVAIQIVAANNARRGLVITNTSSSVDIYYGPDASVTTSTGLPLYANQTLTLDKVPEGYGGAIYGITASGTAAVRYWQNANVG